MTDYHSVETLFVFRDGEQVGTLHRLPKGCEFKYSEEFLRSNAAPIARHLPKLYEGIVVEGLANIPTYFAGLLPEGVMFSAVRRLIGSAADDFFAVLAATGSDSIGDIETRIPGEGPRTSALGLSEAKKQIEHLLDERGAFDASYLSAISGIQPKLSLGQIVGASRTRRYVAKFQSRQFPNLLENEFAFTQLARRCRLNVSETELVDGVLVMKRFDRIYDKPAQALRSLHVEDMLQVMDLFPNSKYSMEYFDLLSAMADLGVSKATLLDSLELYLFSYIIGNGDLHAKNVSLIFDKETGQWILTPVYDLISTLPYTNMLPEGHRMALALVEDNIGRFSREEFLEFGERFRLPAKSVHRKIDGLVQLVTKFADPCLNNHVSSDVISTIRRRADSLR